VGSYRLERRELPADGISSHSGGADRKGIERTPHHPLEDDRGGSMISSQSSAYGVRARRME
jgi:hypothetical protein